MSQGKGAGHAPPPIEERVSFLIHRVNAQLARVCNPFFARYDLDLYSSRILVVVLEKDSLKVGELVELMALPQSTISHQLRRLDKQGLIRRDRLRDDNRSVVVSLTGQGKRLAHACNQLSSQIYDAMIEDIPASDLDLLRQGLGVMFARLKSLEDTDF